MSNVKSVFANSLKFLLVAVPGIFIFLINIMLLIMYFDTSVDAAGRNLSSAIYAVIGIIVGLLMSLWGVGQLGNKRAALLILLVPLVLAFDIWVVSSFWGGKTPSFISLILLIPLGAWLGRSRGGARSSKGNTE